MCIRDSVWIEYMRHALKGAPVQELEAPEGVMREGDQWVFDEFGAGRGVRAVGLEDKIPSPASEDERSGILDLFRR